MHITISKLIPVIGGRTIVVKILVTSGGTSEKIDNVRKITNMASGRLGAAIADEFIRTADAQVTYIAGESAILPSEPSAKIIKTESAEDLLDTISLLLAKNEYTAVIHAMAVSDYKVSNVASVDGLVKSIIESIDLYGSGNLTEAVKAGIINNKRVLSVSKKISSEIENLVLFMEKTPKVIGRIKKLQPTAILVGFKLLNDVEEDELINVAYDLLLKNECDFVLANDLKKVEAENHEGLLIKADRTFCRLHTKKEIAAAIVKNVTDKAGVMMG